MNLPERVSATWKNEANPSCCMHCIRDDYVLKAQSHKGEEERFQCIFFFLLQNPIPLRAINIRYERAQQNESIVSHQKYVPN